MSAAAAAQDARAVDGDTLVLDGVRYRLWGIDAVERDQPCGPILDCGEQAWDVLRIMIEEHGPIHCVPKDKDRYGRTVATCYDPKGHDLAEVMVLTGWALDWPRYSGGAYARDQADAQAQGNGMWAVHAPVVAPWTWRHRKP